MSDGSRRYARVCLSLFLGVTMLLGFVTVPAMAEMAEQPEGQMGYEGDGAKDEDNLGEDDVADASVVAQDAEAMASSDAVGEESQDANALGVLSTDPAGQFTPTPSGYHDTTGTAEYMAPSTQYKGELSWDHEMHYYKFHLDRPGRITVSGSYSGSSLLDVKILDAEIVNANNYVDTIGDSWRESADGTINGTINGWTDLAAGTYYLKMNSTIFSSYVTLSYSIRMTKTEAKESFAEQHGGSDNTEGTANPIALNKKYYGFIAQNDQHDYYKFTLNSKRTITVTGECGNSNIGFMIDSYQYILGTKWDESKGVGTLSRTMELKAGEHYFRASNRGTPKGNETGTYSFTVYDGYPSVDMANCTATLPNKTMEYTGGRLYNKPSVYAGSRLLKEGTDYTLSYANCLNVGNATVTIEGAGKNTGTRTLTYQITRAPISKVELVDAIPTQWFSGSPCTPGVKLRYNGYDLVKGKDYKIGWSKNTGTTDTGYVTVWGIGNFSGERTFPFKVRVKSTLGPGDPFPDVKPGAWYYNVVNEAAALGLVQGYANGNFGPNAKITRAQVAIILWRMAGEPSVGSGAKSFRDVRHGAYYYVPVRWASSVGVVSGYGNTGFFGPDDPVTREQLATMLANYTSKFAGKNVSGSANDYASMWDCAKVSDYAVKMVGWCFKKGVLSGKGGNRIDPQGNATRAEAAKMILKVYKLIYN